MEKLKLTANILFSGIGCQERGLENSGVVDLDVLAVSEIDKEAICGYAAIHKGLTQEMIKDRKSTRLNSSHRMMIYRSRMPSSA